MTLQTFVVAFLAVIVLSVVLPVSSSPSFYSSTLTAPQDNPSPPFKTKYFESQVIDHFNFQTNSLGNNTWTQRYLVWDDAYYGKNNSNNSNPIFFYTGNEGPITWFYNNSGAVFELAQQYNALVIFAEHRYYGQSLPFGNSSFSRNNVGYLSVEQALSDYAVLIAYLREEVYNVPPTVPVVAFGGSYGGMLSGWMRISYPYTIDAALAASAPIPVASGVPFLPQYYDTVTNDFAQVDANCPDLVRQSFAQAIDLASQGQQGLDQLASTFSLCSPLSPPNASSSFPLAGDDADLKTFIQWIVTAFGSLAMADYPYGTDFLGGGLPPWPVNVSCQMYIDNDANGVDALTSLAEVTSMFYNSSGPDGYECFDIAEEFVFCADQTGCGVGDDGLAWGYQTCTEIVYYPSTNNVTDMFPPSSWNLTSLNAYCMETWGVTPRPDWISTYYGTPSISQTSRIIFSNGLLDPWHGGGFLQSTNPEVVALIIDESAHHLDLRASNPADPQSVTNARLVESKLIGTWIQQATQERQARSG